MARHETRQLTLNIAMVLVLLLVIPTDAKFIRPSNPKLPRGRGWPPRLFPRGRPYPRASWWPRQAPGGPGQIVAGCWAHQPHLDTIRELERFVHVDCRPSLLTCAYVGSLPMQCRHMPITVNPWIRVHHVHDSILSRCRGDGSLWRGREAVPFCSSFPMRRWTRSRDHRTGKCESVRCRHRQRRVHKLGHKYG